MRFPVGEGCDGCAEYDGSTCQARWPTKFEVMFNWVSVSCHPTLPRINRMAVENWAVGNEGHQSAIRNTGNGVAQMARGLEAGLKSVDRGEPNDSSGCKKGLWREKDGELGCQGWPGISQ